ncbi:hypothetical protein [Paenibacillus elgii]|uniref:hypothetical protein n=1 Tax=Paenibacillus elgii TaxID=189691 RepID=UPI00203BC764|nr:hypothetical protein [Paenibacillus elgii]MCM3273068.1 hypothetical protein [Paenibacillus elgii]
MSEQLDRIEQVIMKLADRFDSMQQDVSSIKQQLDRIEQNQNDDVIAMLSVVKAKLETTASKEEVSALARIQGEQQLRIELLKKAE